MVRVAHWLAVAVVLQHHTHASPQTSNAIDFTEDRVEEENRYKALIQELCKFRPPNEYFR